MGSVQPYYIFCVSHRTVRVRPRWGIHEIIISLFQYMEVKTLANIKSAKKRVVTSAKRAERNKAIRTAVKTYVKKVETAVEAGNKEEANQALTVAISQITKAANKGILHKNTAARKVSRLTKLVNGLQ